MSSVAAIRRRPAPLVMVVAGMTAVAGFAAGTAGPAFLVAWAGLLAATQGLISLASP